MFEPEVGVQPDRELVEFRFQATSGNQKERSLSGKGRDVDIEMLGFAREAFSSAIERVSAAPASVARAMYGPLAESIWWAICIDEELEFTGGYKSRRNTDQQGNVVNGLRYARSALGHHRFFAVQAAGGLTIPFVVPFKIEMFAAWLPVADLPDFEWHSTFRPRYEEHVAGRRVLDTLVDAAEWFERACVESRFNM